MELFNKNALDDLNNLDKEKPTGKKKMILIAIVVCIVLIVILTVLVMLFKEIDSKTFKLYVNDQRVKTSSTFYSEYNGKTYVKASELASYIGWSYQNGAYGEFSEDNTKGYFKNSYEAASIEANSNVVKKYVDVSNSSLLLNNKSASTNEVSNNSKDQNNDESSENAIKVYSENGTLETSEIDLPVIYINNALYIPFDNLRDICNCFGNYQSYRMYIYDMSYLENMALTKAASFGYSSVSSTYENMKALAYNMLVVLDNSGKYGVVNLSTGEQILGFKYSDIVFCQNVKEFLVKADNTVGIVSTEGDVIISPKNYDDIKIISDSLGLYLVKENNKYGVLNRNGETVVYPDYDSLGLDEKTSKIFEYGTDKNKYVLNDNLIVVENGGKFGLFNLEGNQALAVRYENFGYINAKDEKLYQDSLESSNSSNSSTKKDDKDNEDSNSSDETEDSQTGDSVLTIDLEYGAGSSESEESEAETDDSQTEETPETKTFHGIVVGLDVDGTKLYGVYNLDEQRLTVPCACTRIYSITKSGNKKYYLEFNGEQVDLQEYLEENS